MSVKRLIAVLAGVVLLGGCSDSSSGAPAGTQSTGKTVSGTPGSGVVSEPPSVVASTTNPPAPGPPIVPLGDADKGRTVTVAVGQQVSVTLTGGDWTFVDPKPASVLTPSSPPVVANGTTSISYRGGKPGTATATASRGADTYEITVVVK